MAAWDWENGPLPEIRAYRIVDAMGETIPDCVFVETECGLCVRLLRDAEGAFLIDDETGGIRRRTETRPAPIQLVPV